MTSQGAPWSLVRDSKNNHANSAASMLLVLGMQWACLKKWSTNVKMQSFRLKDAATSVMESTPTCSQQYCATGCGIDKPTTVPVC